MQPGQISFPVLVVDDDASIRATYRNILQPPPSQLGDLEALISGNQAEVEQSPFQVTEAEQGEIAARLQADALARGVRYPLAFIDMRMPPGWDGLRTAVRLRAQDPSIYIVIATAFSDYDVNELQRQLGHDVVLLRKPFNQEEVFQLARTLCQSWNTRMHLEAVTAEMESRVRQRTLELERRNALQEVQIDVAGRFNEVGPDDDIDDAVNWSLARLGRVIDVDSCSLFRYDATRDHYCLSHEWHALGSKPLPASMQTIPRGDIAPAHARFLRGEVFLFDRQAEPVPELGALSRLADDLYDRIMAVPLEIGTRLSGFLAIGTARSADSLDPFLVQLLFTVGHAISSAQDALEARHRLNESRVMLERTESITRTGSWQWDQATDSVIWLVRRVVPHLQTGPGGTRAIAGGT
jgi:CheY-like chemotaxis protein